MIQRLIGWQLTDVRVKNSKLSFFSLIFILFFIYFLILDLGLKVKYNVTNYHNHSYTIIYHTEKYRRFQNDVISHVNGI